MLHTGTGAAGLLPEESGVAVRAGRVARARCALIQTRLTQLVGSIVVVLGNADTAAATRVPVLVDVAGRTRSKA